MKNSARISALALTLSASGFIATAVREGYREQAYIPVPGDVPTIGFGDTSGVKMGDRTTPVRAMIKLEDHIDASQAKLKDCLGEVPLFQYEWDAFVTLSINVGPGAVCKSSIKTKLQSGDYAGACKTILDFNKFKGSVLKGLVNAREREYKMCMGLGYGY